MDPPEQCPIMDGDLPMKYAIMINEWQKYATFGDQAKNETYMEWCYVDKTPEAVLCRNPTGSTALPADKALLAQDTRLAVFLHMEQRQIKYSMGTRTNKPLLPFSSS